jgi:anoctamin-10
LDIVRNHFGEKLAFYFAYTQHYFLSLVPLAILGVSAHFLLPAFNPLYGICLMAWTIGFKHSWERRQRDLAVRWGVRGFTQLVEQRRAAYVTQGERVDPVTGERRGWFPLYVFYAVVTYLGGRELLEALCRFRLDLLLGLDWLLY